MSDPCVNLSALSPGERLSAFDRAVTAIQEGGLVLAASDAAYFLLAGLDTIAGQSGLLAAAKNQSVGPIWLAPNFGRIEKSIPGLGFHARRLLRRLWPGPAIAGIELDEAHLEIARRDLQLGPAVVDQDGALWACVPADSAAATIVSRRSTTVGGVEIFDAGGRPISTFAAAIAACRGLGLETTYALDSGDIPHRSGATVLKVSSSGQPRILREGAFEERFIRKSGAVSVLFVCSGNTCRSPMAEAIASGLVAKQGLGERVQVRSAGTSAGMGEPSTPEAGVAVRALGLPFARHASQPVSRTLIEQADVIYVMTTSHKAAVLSMNPGAAGKIALLDPENRDIPDPIGQGQETYNATARRMEALITRRLKELGT